MTPRKKLAIAGIALALTLAAGIGGVFAFVALFPPASVEQKLDDVRPGMTRGEVVEILGRPRPPSRRSHFVVGSFACFVVVWEDDRGTAWVYFAGDRVTRKRYFAKERTQ